MRAEAFEDNIGPLGTTIKMKRVDWDAVIDRWMGRVANLESLRQKLLQAARCLTASSWLSSRPSLTS
ncbi:hypothetical protein HB762_28155 (plasmid) [Vibrio campbellii]|uniref:Uncharacterized protein n=1 Tax=Vibrio campbellii TaxID=680 RepID=A0ABY5ILM1_9VIBR|nr:hypothetical protein [Vibrio campbellii]UTZ35137.1 hypothetical protein HB762_28155 [Vibrio campbellii]